MEEVSKLLELVMAANERLGDNRKIGLTYHPDYTTVIVFDSTLEHGCESVTITDSQESLYDAMTFIAQWGAPYVSRGIAKRK